MVEGDGEIAEAETGGTTEGGFALATKSVSPEVPSQITRSDDEREYRLGWNALATHTAFSRVVPDIGSLDLNNPFDSTGLESARIFGNKNSDNRPVMLGVSKAAAETSAQIRANIGLPNNKLRPSTVLPNWGFGLNEPSPKCFFQRRRGAREREAAMFLEHFYVAYSGEDETHQINKRANLLPLNYTRDNWDVPGGHFPPYGFNEPDTNNPPHSRNADVGDAGWTRDNPFSLETHFIPGEGNAERHIRVPTSRQRLWFGGGTSWGSEFQQDKDVNDAYTGYYGNVPCLDCKTEVAGSFEKVVPALLKRYGYFRDDGSNQYEGCANAFKTLNGQLRLPNDFVNGDRFPHDKPNFRNGVCHAEEL